jgi:hypothetical protein
VIITPQVIIPTLLVPLIAYRIYRRVRSNFGRQPIQPRRMLVRVILFAAIGSLLMWMAVHSVALFATATAGIALGGGLAALGLRLTQWHTDETGTHYTPNAYLGIAITALLLGRITYRLVSMSSTMGAVAPTGDGFLATYQQSPLTLGIVTLTIGYYLVYFTGLLIVARTRAGAPAVTPPLN